MAHRISIGYHAPGHSQNRGQEFNVPDAAGVDAVQDALGEGLKSLRAGRSGGQGPATQRVTVFLRVDDGAFSETLHSFNVHGSAGIDAVQAALFGGLTKLAQVRDAQKAAKR